MGRPASLYVGTREIALSDDAGTGNHGHPSMCSAGGPNCSSINPPTRRIESFYGKPDNAVKNRIPIEVLETTIERHPRLNTSFQTGLVHFYIDI